MVLLVFLGLTLGGPLISLLTGQATLRGDWRTASRESAGTAPLPEAHSDALVHVYAARAFKWRGAFGVHTWIATKEKDAPHWTTLQVTGWRQWRGLPVIEASIDVPDRNWYGQRPVLLGALSGDAATDAIRDIETAAERYPWPDTYELWPGPNSNTFVAWIAREVPALNVRLPVTAIGKDYLGKLIAPAPSNTGWTVSLGGVLGLTLARTEGVELNWLGTGAGLDLTRPALKLPGLGRIGLPAMNTP